MFRLGVDVWQKAEAKAKAKKTPIHRVIALPIAIGSDVRRDEAISFFLTTEETKKKE